MSMRNDRLLEAIAVIAHPWPTSGEETRRGDLERQRVGDAIDQADREPDLRQVSDRLVRDPSLAKTVQVPRRNRIRAARKGGQEVKSRIESGVPGRAVTQGPFDDRPVARLASPSVLRTMPRIIRSLKRWPRSTACKRMSTTPFQENVDCFQPSQAGPQRSGDHRLEHGLLVESRRDQRVDVLVFDQRRVPGDAVDERNERARIAAASAWPRARSTIALRTAGARWPAAPVTASTRERRSPAYGSVTGRRGGRCRRRCPQDRQSARRRSLGRGWLTCACNHGAASLQDPIEIGLRVVDLGALPVTASL
jgi:hypothetical protein